MHICPTGSILRPHNILGASFLPTASLQVNEFIINKSVLSHPDYLIDSTFVLHFDNFNLSAKIITHIQSIPKFPTIWLLKFVQKLQNLSVVLVNTQCLTPCITFVTFQIWFKKSISQFVCKTFHLCFLKICVFPLFLLE